MSNRLTGRQRKFCELYLKSGNATRAAIDAGYSPKVVDKQISSIVGSPAVQEYLHKIYSKSEKLTTISSERLIDELISIGFSKITDYLEIKEEDISVRKGKEITTEKVTRLNIFPTSSMDKSAIRAISEVRATKHGISIKLHDKISALDKIARMMGYITDKVDHTTGGKPINTIGSIPIVISTEEQARLMTRNEDEPT